VLRLQRVTLGGQHRDLPVDFADARGRHIALRRQLTALQRQLCRIDRACLVARVKHVPFFDWK
jgi:hypothetical protein